ncbi:PLD nuclease N-terminal domain-containing protein [Nocardioides euryhalodurans]|uniref:PLDc_N domain-containing protein n=1 Tax=Nocardioides euryhalodurans TaxID=2518370 RepID=A0A4P7GPF1_9ACTN|nr:PLD nuclease N-terminal domain-containing protein [Nocardioides euryhalodurans]QBR93667.1 PLDc_N domain-containing protein [Nocardioides euryhalodurans]
MAQKSWSELSPSQQRAIVAVGVVETVLTVAALVDLARRPAEGVRGPKAAWALATFVQPVGPVAYFVAGRK